MTSSMALPITVVVLTKNESETIGGAIASVAGAFDEVVVLDSFSTDNTVELAGRAGVRVQQRHFDGYASQRNYALRDMAKRNEWVLFLDADERVTPELVRELKDGFSSLVARGVRMLYVRRKDMFEGRWLRRSSGYPTWFGRICHAPSVHIEREINEEYHCSGRTSKLEQHLVHYPFAKGLRNWLDRHNSYSTAEALTKAAGEVGRGRLFARDPSVRRQAAKQIFMRLPCRPMLAFVYLYIIRTGFLDGRAGLRYAMLRAFYELMISIKIDEIRCANVNRRQGEC